MEGIRRRKKGGKKGDSLEESGGLERERRRKKRGRGKGNEGGERREGKKVERFLGSVEGAWREEGGNIGGKV